MARRKLVAGNWKMNGSRAALAELDATVSTFPFDADDDARQPYVVFCSEMAVRDGLVYHHNAHGRLTCLDAATGAVLAESRADLPGHPASVTKLMTALLVLEDIRAQKLTMRSRVTVTKAAVRTGGNQVWLAAGAAFVIHGWEPVDAAARPTVLRDTRRQLEEYFAGTRRTFDLPLSLHGSPFQVEVWRTLAQIPYGRTWSYSQLANTIGKPLAVRAVGAANGRNPIPIVLPCHRVIGADGSLTGFGGGLPIKEALLRLEGALPHQAPALFP